MNTFPLDVLYCRLLAKENASSQRHIAKELSISVGKANQLTAELIEKSLINYDGNQYILTDQGRDYLDQYKVDNAIILAAGFGSRFVPFTYETPKGFLKVKGTPMIERQIEQLQASGIEEIIVVVGYLKEAFDYLIDKYGVKLVYNPEYAEKNNFVSLYYALEYLKNSYVLMADNWIEESIFNTWEPVSWFSCLYFEGETDEWGAQADAKQRITEISIGGSDTWAVVGPAFFTTEFSTTFADLTRTHYRTPGTDNDYWEHVLKDNLAALPPMYMNKQSSTNVYEFESLKELRLYDSSYHNNSNNATMQAIAQTFNCPECDIQQIEPLKAGVTNYSFVFSIKEERYVFRTPGIGTEKLINREQEKAAYEAVSPLHITDEIIAFDAKQGTKISKFYNDVHIVDAENAHELAVSARLIKMVHTSGAHIDYDFDIERMISYYRSLAEEANAIRFSDFDEVAQAMQELIDLKDHLAIEPVLCHGDFANTNVLIFPDGSGRIIDWEYSGMADPIMDISMFAIYSHMSRNEIERFFNFYCDSEPSVDELRRLYLYVALGGFLWCIWAEYKQAGGQEFGEYPLKMYRYAKDYYRILKTEGYLDSVS